MNWIVDTDEQNSCYWWAKIVATDDFFFDNAAKLQSPRQISKFSTKNFIFHTAEPSFCTAEWLFISAELLFITAERRIEYGEIKNSPWWKEKSITEKDKISSDELDADYYFNKLSSFWNIFLLFAFCQDACCNCTKVDNRILWVLSYY